MYLSLTCAPSRERKWGVARSRPFAHAACHAVGTNLTMIDSYHCSRYNTNTGRLTEEMFVDVFRDVAAFLEHGS